MKKNKLLIPILALPSIVGVVTPLIASCAKQDENVTIHFYVSGDGSLDSKTADAKIGMKWSELTLPKVTPNNGYVFMGWFNGNNAMKNDQVIVSDMTITARFLAKPTEPVVIDGDGFNGFVDEDTGGFVLNTIPNKPAVVVPSQVLYDNGDGVETYDVTTIAIQFNVHDIQSVYLPKTLNASSSLGTGDHTTSGPQLTNIFVDPENEVFTSRSAAGKECSCLIAKETTDSDAEVILGSQNSVIPNDLKIKKINEGSFWEYTGENIVLPDTLEIIDSGAFGCSSLKTIDIPKNVSLIGNSAFSLCPNLEEVNMLGVAPTTDESVLLTIGRDAFYKCEKLKTVNFSKNVEKIDQDAFRWCSSLESISIPACTININKTAFRGCQNLTSIVIDSKNEVYSSANSNCILKKVPNDQWELITGCQTTVIPSICTSIGENAFNQCIYLKEIKFPASVTSIGQQAFYGCKGLTSVDIPKTVQTIDANAFGNCQSIKNLTINNGVKTIGYRAFYNCIRLESVIIPESIVEDYPNAFESCSSLQSVEIKSVGVGSYAFQSCASLKTITLSDNVANISRNAFENCIALENIVIPKNVVTISSAAFNNCSSLANVSFAERIQNLGISDRVFKNCKSLREIILPKQVILVGAYVFDSCLLKNKTISYAGTYDEFMANYSSWSSTWNYTESDWGDDIETIEKVICLNEPDESKKVIIIDDLPDDIQQGGKIWN